MYCKECGNKIEEGSKFCNKCGKKVEFSYQENNASYVAPNFDNNLNNNINMQSIQTNNNNNNANQYNNLNSFQTNNNENINEFQNQNYNQYKLNNNMNLKKESLLDKLTNNKQLFISIIIILALIIIGTIIFIIANNSNKKINPQVVNNQTTTRDIIATTTTNKNHEEKVSINNTEVVGNYEFTIPDELSHGIQSNQLYVTDNNSFAFTILPGKASYEYYKNNLQTIVTELSQNGMTINNYGEKNYSGLNYLIMEFENQGENGVLSIYELSSSEIAMNVLMTVGETTEYGFDKLGEVLKTAKKVNSGSASDFNIKSFGKDISSFDFKLKK